MEGGGALDVCAAEEEPACKTSVHGGIELGIGCGWRDWDVFAGCCDAETQRIRSLLKSADDSNWDVNFKQLDWERQTRIGYVVWRWVRAYLMIVE